MSLKSKVDSIYSELELLEKKVRDGRVYNPKYQADINRLKFQSHQLHSDALTVDQLTHVSRMRPDRQIREIEKRIFLLSHEVGYLKESYSSFVRFDRNPGRSSGIFSSPSESGSPAGVQSPVGRSPGMSSSSGSQYSSSQSLSQSSQSSTSSQESFRMPQVAPNRFYPNFETAYDYYPYIEASTYSNNNYYDYY